MARASYSNEVDVLEKINNMTENEIIDFRNKNKEHDERIAQRKVRNFISGIIKRFIDLFGDEGGKR